MKPGAFWTRLQPDKLARRQDKAGGDSGLFTLWNFIVDAVFNLCNILVMDGKPAARTKGITKMTKIWLQDKDAETAFAVLFRNPHKAAAALMNASRNGFKATMGTIEPGDRRTLQIF